MERRWDLCAILLLAGSACVAYEPRELDPARSAERYQARTLEDPELASFVRERSGRELSREALDLEQLVLIAAFFSPEVRAARAELAARRASVATADQSPNPELALTPEYVGNADPGTSDWVLGAVLDWPLETAGKRELRVERARLEVARAALELDAANWRVRSDLRVALAEQQLARRAAEAARSVAELSEQRVATLRRQFEAGALARPVVLDAEIERGRAEARALELESRASVARTALARALAVPESALDRANVALLELETLPELAPAAELLRTSLVRRTDVASALLAFRAADVEVRLAVARQWPDVRLGPGYQWDQGQHKFILGAAFELPLAHGQGAAIAEANAKREASAASFEAVQARAIGEIEVARSRLAAATRELAASRELIERARARERSVQRTFESGEVARIERVDAALARATAELESLEAAGRAERAREALEDALQSSLESAPRP